MARIYIPEHKHHKNPYPGNIFAAGSLIVVNIDPLELEVGGASIGASGVNPMLIRDDLPELKMTKVSHSRLTKSVRGESLLLSLLMCDFPWKWNGPWHLKFPRPVQRIACRDQIWR